MELTDRATAQDRELGRRLAAGHHQAALMAGLADGSQYCAVAGQAGPIPSLALTWLEYCLKVVEHEQAALFPQELDQDRQSFGLALRWYQVVGRQEADRGYQPLGGRQCVTQAPPVDAQEARCGVLGQARCECGLAD